MATLFDLIANMENAKDEGPKPKPSLDKGKTAVERKLLSGFWNEELPLDKKKVGDMIMAAAKQAGVSPEVFYASAYQEGLRNAKYIGTPEDGDAAFDSNTTDEYPVNGFFHYGLDTFGDKADSMKKKGYLPADFEYQPFRAVNEKSQAVNSGAFKTNQDALYAKAAYLREFQDQVQDYATKKGVKVDGDALNYFTMAAYNGGIGNAMKMIDEARGRNVSEYVSKGLTTRQGVHRNIEPRMRYAKIMKDYLAEQTAQAAITPAQAPVAVPVITDGTLGLINRGF